MAQGVVGLRWLLEASFKQAGYFLFSGQRHGFGLARLGFSWIGFFGAAEGVFASKLCSYGSRGGGGLGNGGSRLRIAAPALLRVCYGKQDGWQLCAGLQDRETKNPADPKVSRTKPPLSGHEQVSCWQGYATGFPAGLQTRSLMSSDGNQDTEGVPGAQASGFWLSRRQWRKAL
jgi:hypothetical protein